MVIDILLIQCVQIRVGYYEVDREALIAFLKENKACLDVICIRRSRCEGEKAVLVYTADGKKLVDYAIENYPSRDCVYEVQNADDVACDADTR